MPVVGRRRDVSCDTVGTELLAQMVELLFPLEGLAEWTSRIVLVIFALANRALLRRGTSDTSHTLQSAGILSFGWRATSRTFAIPSGAPPLPSGP